MLLISSFMKQSPGVTTTWHIIWRLMTFNTICTYCQQACSLCTGPWGSRWPLWVPLSSGSCHISWCCPLPLESIENNNNNKHGAYKALTTEVSKRYNKRNTMIQNNILNKTKNYKYTYKLQYIYDMKWNIHQCEQSKLIIKSNFE